MDKRRHTSGRTVMMLCLLMTVITFFQLSRMGILTNNQYITNEALAAPTFESNLNVKDSTHNFGKFAVIYDKKQITNKNIVDNFYNLFEIYRIPYDLYSKDEEIPKESDYKIIICLFDQYENSRILQSVLDRLEEGALVYFPMMPVNSDSFISLSGVFGIVEKNYTTKGTSIIDVKGIFGEKGKEFDLIKPLNMNFRIRLRSDCDVYFVDENQNPLLWKRKVGNGHVFMSSCNDLSDYYSRGVVAQVLYEGIQEEGKSLVYPSYNVLSLLLEDFITPNKDVNSPVLAELDTDFDNFVQKDFWPYISSNFKKYGIPPTVSYVLSYDENTKGDFQSLLSEAFFNTYATEILNANGEIAFHGYSLRPLGLKGELDDTGWFIPWKSFNSIKKSLSFAQSFSKDILPNYNIYTYLPPQGRISENVYNHIKDLYSDMKVIMAPYRQTYSDQLNNFYTKGQNGVTTVAITGDIYNLAWTTVNSLMSLGVFCPSINIHDLLANSDVSIDQFKEELDQSLKFASVYPNIKKLTAYNMGQMVGYYNKMSYSYTETEDYIDLEIDGYFEGVSFMVKTKGIVQQGEDYTADRFLGNNYIIYPKSKSIKILKK